MRSSKQHHRATGKRAGQTTPRMTQRNTDDADVHSVLWKSYLPDDARSKLLAVSKQHGGPPRSLPEILEDNQGKILKPLLGIAVWNQVPVDPTALDPALERLLHSVLDLDGDAARSLRSSPLYEAFPPYPDQLILDTRYVEQHHGRTAIATLEICVPTPSDPQHPNTQQATELTRLKLIADPRTWSACRLFWSQIERCDPSRIVKQPKAKRSIKARLHLPGETGVVSEPVTLDIVEFSYDNPLRAHIRFEIRENRLTKLCHGHISVHKEPGRPGAARISNRKIVQFAPGWLDNYAFETLRYWLQAETMILIDAVSRSHRGGDK